MGDWESSPFPPLPPPPLPASSERHGWVRICLHCQVTHWPITLMHIDCDSLSLFPSCALSFSCSLAPSLSCRPQRHRSSTLDRRHLSCLLSHILHAAPPCTWWALQAGWENPPLTLLVLGGEGDYVGLHKYELCGCGVFVRQCRILDSLHLGVIIDFINKAKYFRWFR